MATRNGGVSTAEKRAELLAAGEGWPTYPDGTKQLWQRDPRKTAGGYFCSWGAAQDNRARAARRRVEGGVCSMGGCSRSCWQGSSGKFDVICHDHRLDRQRRYSGANVSLGAPPLPPQEIARRSHATRRLRRRYDDPVVMKRIEEHDPKRAKLIRLAFHPSTPLFEKRAALNKLIPAPTEVQ